MYEVVDVTNNYSHGAFDTMSEARGAVAFDRLQNWAIYGPSGHICEWSREPGVEIAPLNPHALISTVCYGR